MSTDPFVILGIDKSSNQSEILEAYKNKRSYYSAHVFDEGESGAEAARMLEILDNAYQSAMEYCHENATVSGGTTETYSEESFDTFSEVKAALTAKDYVKAQELLDNIMDRNGEWHYYQAIIYYEKSWLNESKRQLEFALQQEPDNQKYIKALEGIKRKIDGTRPFEGGPKQDNAHQTHNETNRTATRRTYSQQNRDTEDGCCAACQALWCADCCCECMGGDLISCC